MLQVWTVWQGGREDVFALHCSALQCECQWFDPRSRFLVFTLPLSGPCACHGCVLCACTPVCVHVMQVVEMVEVRVAIHMVGVGVEG